VSLEEIENSAAFGKNRDDALSTLTTALNTAAGSEVWAFVPSPAALPASEDVIRTAFIYKKATVRTEGDSRILTTGSAFANARRPLAQKFGLVGKGDDSEFIAIANHSFPFPRLPTLSTARHCSSHPPHLRPDSPFIVVGVVLISLPNPRLDRWTPVSLAALPPQAQNLA
jgi:hypothetical protein